MALVGSLVASLSANTTDFDRGMQNAQRQLTGVQQGVKTTQTSLAGLGTSFAALGASLVSLTALKAGLDAVIASGDQMTRLSSAFAAVTGSQQGARESLEFVREAANRLGVNFGELADAYKGVAAASKGTTLEGAATRDIFTAITNASRVLQLSTQDTQGVLLAVQQIMSKGTVSAEELRGQIGERLPGAFNIAARAMGVTTAELGKLLESGQLLATTFLPRFARQLQTELGDSATHAAATFGQAMTRLKNATGDVAAEVAKSGVVSWLTSVVDKLAEIIAKGPAAARELEKVAQAGAEKALKPVTAMGGTAAVPAADQQAMLEAQRKVEQARKTLEDQLAGNTKALDRFLPAFIQNYAVDKLREAVAAAEKARDDLLKRIEQDALKRAGEQEGMGAFGPSRYTAAVDIRTQIAQIENEATKQVEVIRRRLDLGATVEERKKGMEEMLQATEKGLQAIRTMLASQPGMHELLKREGPGAITAEPTEGGQKGGTAFQAMERLRAQQAGLAQLLEKPVKDVQGFNVELRASEEITRKVTEQARELEGATTSNVEATERFITTWEQLHGTMGEASKALLRSQAEALDTQTMTQHIEEGIAEATVAYREVISQVFAALRDQLTALDPTAMRRVLMETLPELGDIPRSGTATISMEDMEEKVLPALKIALLQARVAFDDFITAQKQNQVIQQTVEGLEAQTRALTMTREAQLELLLTQNRATETQRSFARATLDTAKQAEAATQVTSFMFQTFEDFVFRGEFSFRKFAEAFTEMVFRIVVQSAELDKSFTKLIVQGIQLGLSLLGGTSGLTAAAGTTGRVIDVVDTAGVAATSIVTRQHGGMVFPMQPTLVGERGPELILPTVPGVVLSHSQTRSVLGAAMPTVIVNISTPNAQSFQQSRGQVSRAILNAIAQAQRSL